MNILPQLRNPSALFALAIVAPVLFLAAGNFHLPSANDSSIQMDNTVAFNFANVGIVDELRSVQANLAEARRAFDDKDYDRANRLTEDARVDALVAEQHAQSTLARKAAQDSQNIARALSAEIAVKTRAVASN